MLLACDIGNSSSNFGIFDEKNNIVKTFKVNTAKISSLNDLKRLFAKNFSPKEINNASISSVVPSADPIYKEFFDKMKINSFYISSKIKLNIRICLENSNKLGSDRIANVSYAFFTGQKFHIIVDSGTALTIDVMDKRGHFLGGIIFPGLSMLTNSLYQSTEKLPIVEATKKNIKKIGIIGTNTENSILSGIYFGYIYSIKGFIDNIYKYYNCTPEDANIIITGGNCNLITDALNLKYQNKIDKFWTLKGIKYLYDLNIGDK
ncbi:type III pantothenate kinase [Candidatus Acidulodesulfobacterium sp. H_13]|uniref:type III pantothenate kinase n=1 Tax=Candidatus Acidulodesulfobacterium sp. H_13 TaxID=3395470 RepID=UPI003AF6D744